REALLIVPGEAVGRVTGEAGGGGDGIVGRIEVDEIAGRGLADRILERRVEEVRPRQHAAGGEQRPRVVEARIRVASDGDVEAPGAVHAPEAVEACLVQVDEPGGALGGREVERIEGADALVMLPFVDVPRERCEDGVDVVADLAVTVDELGVVVAEDGAAGYDGANEGAAAGERLVISADGGGDVAGQRVEAGVSDGDTT